MVVRIGVLGSCETRDLFNSNINPGYKNYFSIELHALRTSLISLMQNPYFVDEKLLKIFPETYTSIKESEYLKGDCEKTFFTDLYEKNIDVLLMDNYFEVRFGVAYFDGIILTNNDWDLHKTEFYKNTKNIKTVSMLKNPDYYFELWSKNCDLFFEYMETNFPNVKIILNMARLTSVVEKKDGSKYVDENFFNVAKLYNPLLSRLDNYIVKNFDVDVLNFDFGKFNIDENHPWGKAANHYNFNYYSSLSKQIRTIVKSYESDEERLNFLKKQNKEYLQKIDSINYKLEISSSKNSLLKSELERLISNL